MINLKYYDMVLIGIGFSMLFGIILGLFSSLSLPLGAGSGGLLSTIFMYDGMFNNAPVEDVGK